MPDSVTVVVFRESTLDALRRICRECGVDWETARHIPVIHFAALVDARRRAARS